MKSGRYLTIQKNYNNPRIKNTERVIKTWHSQPEATKIDSFLKRIRQIRGGEVYPWLLAVVMKGNLHVQIVEALSPVVKFFRGRWIP